MRFHDATVENARLAGARLLGIALLTAACLTVRLWFLPGWWDTDGLYYAGLVLGIDDFGATDRSLRLLFRGMLEIGRIVSGGEYWGVTLMCMLAGTAVVPATYVAARRRLGADAALWAAGVVGSIPVVFHESIRPSADGSMATLGALLLFAAYGVRSRQAAGRFRSAILVGVIAGVAGVFKEIFLLAALPLALWMVARAVKGRLRWRSIVGAGVAAVTLVVVDLFLTQWIMSVPGRFGAVSGHMGAIRNVDTYPIERFTLGPLPMLLTDQYALGSLFSIAGLTLAAGYRRIARASCELSVAIGTVLALWWLPISSETYAVLPASEPRYLLAGLPAVGIALMALVDRPSRLRRTWYIPCALALPLIYLSRSQLAMAGSLATVAVLLTGFVPVSRGRLRAGIAAATLAGLVGLALPPVANIVLAPASAAAAIWCFRAGAGRAVRLAFLAAWAAVIWMSHGDTLADIRRTGALQRHVRTLGEVWVHPHSERVLRVTSGSEGATWSEMKVWPVRQAPPTLHPGMQILTFRSDLNTRDRLNGLADVEHLLDVYALYRVR